MTETSHGDASVAARWLEEQAALDGPADALAGVAERLLRGDGIRALLRGAWLGHPVHPLLTDLPIGFWTSAFTLDLVGGRRSRDASDLLLAMGTASALPAVAAGLADWAALDREGKRVGVVHAAANAVAVALFAASSVARLAGRRRAGVVLCVVGSAAATAGGYLGGHLAFGRN